MNEKLDQQPSSAVVPEPRRQAPNRFMKILAPVATGVILLVAIGAAALLLRNEPDPTPPAGVTTTVPGTTVAPPETTLPTSTQAPSTDTTAPTTETSMPSTTEAPVADPLLPADAFDGVVAVRAGIDGVVAHGPDREVTLIADSAVAAYADGRGGLVYQLGVLGDAQPDLGAIYHVRPSAAEAQILVIGEDETVELVGVFEVRGEPHAAFTATTGVADTRRDVLRLIGLDNSSVIDVGEVGLFEIGLMDVSVAGELIVIQTSGEGIIENEGRTLSGETAQLTNPPELECGFIGGDEAECHFYLNITDDGQRYVSVAWSGSEGDVADLVVIDLATGAEEHRVPIGAVFPSDVDVAWPFVVINTRVDFSVPDVAYVVDFTDPSSPSVTTVPDVGVAGAVRPG